MRRNLVKRKLAQGQPTIGTWLTVPDLHIARVLAGMGFDWLTLDMEHNPIDLHQAATIFAAVADAGCAPLVRIPTGSPMWIKRVLDAGAFGIVVPMVDTVAQAQAAITAAHYPPRGSRSAGGGMHHLNFGCSADEYYRRADDEILVVLQTESPRGVDNAREIYSLPGCDAVFIGPNDLRFQMRNHGGEFPTAEQHAGMIQRVIDVGREVGTPTGIHARSPAEVLRRIEDGMQFIALSSDLELLTSAASQALDALGYLSDRSPADTDAV
ncbi:MAG: 2-dehydro-3-deoxyglucarate aldolase [Planctomycetota bacterium]|nr:MAG: 2-dehydro-3-deoxyglucarate aldolase [Planctomycetota bacterium]